MSTQANIPKILKDLDRYIEVSSKHASKVLINVNFEPFEGIKMDMSPDVCANIYKDLISRLIKEQRAVIHRYCLLVTLIPISKQSDGNLILSIRLGVLFPD